MTLILNFLPFSSLQKTVSRITQVCRDHNDEEQSTEHTYTLNLSSQCQVALMDTAKHGSIMSVQTEQHNYKLSCSSAQVGRLVVEVWGGGEVYSSF